MPELAGSVTPPAPPPAPPSPPAPPASLASWHSSFDEETRGWIENRGLHQKKSNEAVVELVKTARSAEKKFGVPQDRLITLPASLDEEGVLDPIYDRLGRPAKPADYGLAAPDADDAVGAEFATSLSGVFHKAGLSKSQASLVFKAIDEYATKVYETQKGSTATQRAADMQKLETEWGEQATFNKLLAQEAVKATGASKEEIDALVAALGSDAAVVRFFNRIGQKRGGEATFMGGDNPTLKYGATTPEAAKARLEELRGDKEWAGKFRALMDDPHGAGSALMKEYRALTSLAARAA